MAHPEGLTLSEVLRQRKEQATCLIKNKAGAIMLRPTNAGAATSALFEMKKGAAFLVRQDQQNDAQIFMILF